MSIEMVLYPHNAERRHLKDLLIEHGFTETSHLWPWPKGSLHFAWFDETDFRSTDGVEATTFRLNNGELLSSPGAKWALHTRTRIWANSHDRSKQNEVIRSARRRFGGSFSNDWYGTNRYIPVEEDTSTPLERGLRSTYFATMHHLDAVEMTTPQPILHVDETTPFLKEVVSDTDPTRVVYNALLPILVAALEHLFLETFRILLRYDDKARDKLQRSQQRIKFAEVVAVAQGELTIEDLAAREYRFQNLDSIHRAFREWFGIDVKKLLRSTDAPEPRNNKLAEVLPVLISHRHAVVHRFDINPSFGIEEFRYYTESVRLLVTAFIRDLEKRFGMKILEF